MIIHPTVTFNGKKLRFNHFLGLLLSKNTGSLNEFVVHGCGKIDNLMSIINPYLIKNKEPENIDVKNNKVLTLYAKCLIWLCDHLYFVAILFRHLRLNVFDNGETANEYFYKYIKGTQHELCLSRSIFIVSTSKQFKSEGSFIIGVFLPTHNMHAWVMENGRNVNCYDDLWLDFTPVLIIE